MVQGFDDGVVQTREVGGLRVFVIGRVVKRKGGVRVGEEGEGGEGEGKGGWEVYREATRGMVGGLGDGEVGV